MHFFCRLNVTLIIFLRFSNRKMTTTIILLLVCVQCRSFFLETLQQKWISCVQNLFWFYRICQRISFVCVFLLDLFDLTFASSFRNFSVSLSLGAEKDCKVLRRITFMVSMSWMHFHVYKWMPFKTFKLCAHFYTLFSLSWVAKESIRIHLAVSQSLTVESLRYK